MEDQILAMEEVKIVSTEMLSPASEPLEMPQSRKMKLSIYDWTLRYAAFQRRVLFYSSVGTGLDDELKLIDSLRTSLSQALAIFYPFAARLSIENNSFILDCTKLSVQFNQATTELSLGDLQRLDFSPSKVCDELCVAPDRPWSEDDPLLYVQVTRFSDGGLSIGITFSHHISDGVSAWHFFNSWSQLARSGTVLNPPEISFQFRGLELTEDETTTLAESIGFRRREKGYLMPGSLKFIPASEVGTRLFKLDSSTITGLKELARRSGSIEGTRFTTYEVVCAYFWVQITSARDLPPGKRVQLFLLFNCRDRFGGLTKHYFGNAISMAIVSCRAGELISGGLGKAAELLHEAIKSFDERRNQAYLNIMEQALATSTEGLYGDEIDVDPDGFSLVVSSPRHPVYECDFGFGRPVGATFGTNDLHDGKIYLFPSAGDPSGVDVRIALRPEKLHKLQGV